MQVLSLKLGHPSLSPVYFAHEISPPSTTAANGNLFLPNLEIMKIIWKRYYGIPKYGESTSATRLPMASAVCLPTICRNEIGKLNNLQLSSIN